MARAARLVAVLLSVSLPCAAALARAGLQANAALPASRRSSPPTCYSDDGIDELILYGDAGVLCAYGSVQALFDVWLRPLAELQPDAFVPVIHAPSQAIAIAAKCAGAHGLDDDLTGKLHANRALAHLGGQSAVDLFCETFNKY